MKLMTYFLALLLLNACTPEEAERSATDATVDALSAERPELVVFPLAGLQAPGESWQGEYGDQHPEPLEVVAGDAVTVSAVLISHGAVRDCGPDDPHCCPRFERIEQRRKDMEIRLTGWATLHATPCNAAISFVPTELNLGALEPGTWQITDVSDPEFEQTLIVHPATEP